MNLSFTEIAEQDLLCIKKFIAKSNPQAAERMKDALLSSLQHLTEQPEMGMVLKKVSDNGYLVTTLPAINRLMTRSTFYVYGITKNLESRSTDTRTSQGWSSGQLKQVTAN